MNGPFGPYFGTSKNGSDESESERNDVSSSDKNYDDSSKNGRDKPEQENNDGPSSDRRDESDSESENSDESSNDSDSSDESDSESENSDESSKNGIYLSGLEDNDEFSNNGGDEQSELKNTDEFSTNGNDKSDSESDETDSDKDGSDVPSADDGENLLNKIRIGGIHSGEENNNYANDGDTTNDDSKFCRIDFPKTNTFPFESTNLEQEDVNPDYDNFCDVVRLPYSHTKINMCGFAKSTRFHSCSLFLYIMFIT